MSVPLPFAFRARFQRLIEEGPSGRAAAFRLKLSPATADRWARQVKTRGHAAAAPQERPLDTGKLAPHRAFFEDLLTQDPDITLFELRDALVDAEGVQVPQPSIADLLSRLGFTYKNGAPYRQHSYAPAGQRVATERRRAKARQQRADWLTHRAPAIAALPEGVVCIDETAVKTNVITNLTHLRGWAICGERLTMGAPFGSWGTQTLIAGLSQDALIAPWIKGAMDGPPLLHISATY